jgi:hypothetical protein
VRAFLSNFNNIFLAITTIISFHKRIFTNASERVPRFVKRVSILNRVFKPYKSFCNPVKKAGGRFCSVWEARKLLLVPILNIFKDLLSSSIATSHEYKIRFILFIILRFRLFFSLFCPYENAEWKKIVKNALIFISFRVPITEYFLIFSALI